MTEAPYLWSELQSLSVAGTRTGANEDALAITASSLIMIDGATGLTAGRMREWSSDAQWFAHSLAAMLAVRLDQASPVPVILRTCIEDLQGEYGKDDQAGLGPSASVLIARVRGPHVEVYSLGDCLALIGLIDGAVVAVRDGAVGELDAGVLTELRALRGDLSLAEARPLVKELLVRNRKLRNTPEGYWIADLSAAGVDHAVTRTFHIDDVRDLALMTDGFAAALDLVGLAELPDELLEQLRADGPDAIMTALAARLSNDPECTVYPRLKPMDDSSVAFATLVRTPDSGS